MKSGDKTSEKKVIIQAFVVNVLILLYGVYKGVDLNDLGIALGCINTLPMSYVFGRSYLKSRQGD